MNINEYDRVRLLTDLPSHGLKAGMRGTVLLVYEASPPAFEVEFCNDSGDTLAVLTLREKDIEISI